MSNELKTQSVTRGYGLLEGFLAKKRAAMADRLIPAQSRQGRILDIGCGTVPYFLLNTTFSEKYGLDKVSQGGKETSAGNTKITLTNYDIERDERIFFEDGYFDIVTMLAVFEHIEPSRLPAVIGEVHRILKPGGFFILTTPARWTDAILRTMAWLRLVSSTEIEEHKDAYNTKKIVAVLGQGGFIQENIRTGYFEMGMNIWVKAAKGSP